MKSGPSAKTLILRLSSLGDVVLATSALETPDLTREGVRADWVVAENFAEILENHHRIGKVWKFNKHSGFAGWIRLARELRAENYDHIFDLHASLRTTILYFLFKIWALSSLSSSPRWTRISKQRFRFFGAVLFKKFWPRFLQPTPWVQRYAKTVGGSGRERPSLNYLFQSQDIATEIPSEPYYCVMPGSKWKSKCWTAQGYFEVISSSPSLPVVLGELNDSTVLELLELLKNSQHRFVSGVGKWNLKQAAYVLSRSQGYLGSDTGLAHIAEAVGVPATVVFGPTDPALGFGPWRPESRSVSKELGCRPCGKDGRFCYRFGDRYACTLKLGSDQVARTFFERETSTASVGSHPLLTLYRSVVSVLRIAFRSWVPGARRAVWRTQWNQHPPAAKVPGHRRIWLHAASAGELELIWPLIVQIAEQGSQLILTVFSSSAEKSLGKLLSQDLKERRSQILFAGYSPWESDWASALEAWHPDTLITAKYEAWPNLWASLSEKNIPLWIVAARARRSLQIAKGFCKVFGVALPKMNLLTVGEEDQAELSKLFPSAQVRAAGDPRWDRVHSRAQGAASHQRVQELVQRFAHLPRPWGVLGSAWEQDLTSWGTSLAQLAGTIWIFPHQIDEQQLQGMESKLRELSLSYVRTRGADSSTSPKCVIVNEMGILAEFYSQAQWAYVGGGFGAGVHSVIEPAIQGIPIAAGPSGKEKFPEISLLTRLGQLTILDSASDFQSWAQKIAGGTSGFPVGLWKEHSSKQLGATQRIVTQIFQKTGPSC